MLIFFFFSSRRRHTRFDCDWSSDVCSSDLVSAHWQLSGAQLGFLLSAGLFGMAGGSLLIAPWADRLGRPPPILACPALSGGGMLGSAFSHNALPLSAPRGLTGLGVGGHLAFRNLI